MNVELELIVQNLYRILNGGNKTVQERTENLLLAVKQAYADTNDTKTFDALCLDILLRVFQAQGPIDESCKNVLIPRLMQALLLKYRRVRVDEILQGVCNHTGVSRAGANSAAASASADRADTARAGRISATGR